MHRLTLRVLSGRFAVCRLPPGSPVPAPTGDEELWSVTRTPEEVSVVLPETSVQPGWKAETGFLALQVAGPLDFSLTGVLASIADPLAEAEISLFAIATFDTDYVLIRETDLGRAREALTAVGHSLMYLM